MSKVHLQRMVFKYSGPLEGNLFSWGEGGRSVEGLGLAAASGGARREGETRNERSEKLRGTKREERGWFP